MRADTVITLTSTVTHLLLRRLRALRRVRSRQWREAQRRRRADWSRSGSVQRPLREHSPGAPVLESCLCSVPLPLSPAPPPHSRRQSRSHSQSHPHRRLGRRCRYLARQTREEQRRRRRRGSCGERARGSGHADGSSPRASRSPPPVRSRGERFLRIE